MPYADIEGPYENSHLRILIGNFIDHFQNLSNILKYPKYFVFLRYRKNFPGTEKRLGINHGKQLSVFESSDCISILIIIIIIIIIIDFIYRG